MGLLGARGSRDMTFGSQGVNWCPYWVSRDQGAGLVGPGDQGGGLRCLIASATTFEGSSDDL